MPGPPSEPSAVTAFGADEPFAPGWLARVTAATDADLALPQQSDHGREISQLRELLRSTFSHASTGLALVNAAGNAVIVNAAMCEIVGRSSETLVGMAVRELVGDEDRRASREDHRRLLRGELVSYTAEVRLLSPDRRATWARVTVTRAGRGLNLVLYQVEDVQERRRVQEQLEHAVDHDLLTGLLNRRRFDRELRREVERHHRHGGGGAVLMIDLDGFKAINDQFGHAAGDNLLRGITSRLQRRTRGGDSLARLGGDEFALLIPGASKAAAARVADTLIELIGGHSLAVDGQRPFVTASVGVAMFDGIDSDELLANADAAMYAAKDRGGNQRTVFDPAEQSLRSRLVAEASQLRQALHRDGFVLFCQPIHSLGSGPIDQYELLVRMCGTTPGELLPPREFLGAAERLGLIARLDAWVVLQAVRLIAANAACGRRVVLNVNLSGRSLGDSELAGRIEQIVTDGTVDPTCLVFEITETAAIASFDTACTFADRLRALGCRLALDDFGAGFASFYYLKRLPFDFVKIDGSFVQGLVGSATDQLVVAAIVDVAKGMGKQTIAEYVTDDATLELLRAAGVDYVQGFHIAAPAPVADVLAV